MNHFKIPKHNPFGFVPSTLTPGVFLGDAWASELIRSFMMKAYYKQKWEKADTTKLQIECSIIPDDLKIVNKKGQVLKSIPWEVVFDGVSYKVLELTYDVSDIAEQEIYNYQSVNFGGGVVKAAISEPIDLKSKWPNTRGIIYRNSYNDWDVAFTTGIQFFFRCECDVLDFNPEREANDHISSRRKLSRLWGNSWDSFTFYVAEAPGVAEWVVKLLNKIFDCDYVSIAGKRFTADQNAKWEVTRIRTWPLIGAKIAVVPVEDGSSLEFADATPLSNGLVTAYNIETAFFGPGSLVPIIDVEKQD